MQGGFQETELETAGGRHGLMTHLEETLVLVLEQPTGISVQRIDVGHSQANIGSLSDGSVADISTTGRNEVVAIDVSTLEVIARNPAGEEPIG